MANAETDEQNLQLAHTVFRAVVGKLMPDGKPDFAGVIQYPKLADIKKTANPAVLLLAVTHLVKMFCSSFNVARNMNEDQMIEAAETLIDECGNYRVEDYVMMFQLAKRGKLGKFYERIDFQVISEIKETYDAMRTADALKREDELANELDSLGPTHRDNDHYLKDTRIEKNYDLSGFPEFQKHKPDKDKPKKK